MTTSNFIVLRRKNLLTPTLENLGSSVRFSPRFILPTSIKVDEVELTPKELGDLRRDPDVGAIAPAMPIKLVNPTEAESLGDQEVAGLSGSTWGVKAVLAPKSPYDGSGITVAVLDTGIDPRHPAFKGIELVRKNFTSEIENDMHGHGTHCAGTIFGQDSNGLRFGIARNIQRALIGKVLGKGGGSSATIVKAIEWAANEGAHIISMSLGIDFPGYVNYLVKEKGIKTEPATSIALEGYRANINIFSQVAELIQQQNTLIIAASGNESRRPEYKIAVAPPAAGTGIISVGALGEAEDGFGVAYFSNNQVDIAGPGVGVVSASPGGKLASMSGTSMAAPHVAGVAVLWAQHQLEKTGRVEYLKLLAQLIASGTTKSLAADVEEDSVGMGIVQAPLH